MNCRIVGGLNRGGCTTDQLMVIVHRQVKAHPSFIDSLIHLFLPLGYYFKVVGVICVP
jgi:hypothetical protein